MKRTMTLYLLAAATLLQTGCIGASLSDALAAGFFDFVTGTVTAALSTLFPVPAP